MNDKVPWGEGTPWPKKNNFFNYLRGCLRKAWVNNPIKIQVLNKRRKQIVNPNPKGKKPMVWGFDCEMCNEESVIANCQVDHIHPAGSLQEIEDIQGFIERLLFVTEDDLRLVCKDCNNALAMADKQGISFNEAIIEKKIIKICKEKKDKEFIQEKGLIPASSQDKRKIQIRQILFGEKG
jgi:transcription elongation factor Elf1